MSTERNGNQPTPTWLPWTAASAQLLGLEEARRSVPKREGPGVLRRTGSVLLRAIQGMFRA